MGILVSKRWCSSRFVKDNFHYHRYMDDTQIYLQYDHTADVIEESINQLGKCIADVSARMKKNSLKINEDQ